jgi:malonyl-CoA O-methyltransferase
MISAHRLDKDEVKKAFARAAKRYDDFASLQRQVAEELLKKFSLQNDVGSVLDIGSGTGYVSNRIAKFQECQQLVAVDIALAMLECGRENIQGFNSKFVCADAEKLPFARQSFQQIYSNLALQWCQNLPAVFADCHRVLKNNGQLVFSTFGPATLTELKQAWASVDEFTHVNDFVLPERIMAGLQQAGFKSIHLETTTYQRNYSSVWALMHELKGLGAHNVSSSRNRSITTRRQIQKMINSYEHTMATDELFASYEIIFVKAGK